MININEDLSVVFLYVKKFSWGETLQGKMMNQVCKGHLKVGDVYRGIKSAHGIYSVSYPSDGEDKKHIIISSLKEKSSENSFERDLIEITPESIINCHLTESHLDKMLNWIDDENNGRGLKADYEAAKKKEEETPKEEVIEIEPAAFSDTDIRMIVGEKLSEIDNAEQAALEDICDTLGNVFVTNLDLFNTISDVIKFVSNEDMSASPIARHIILGKDGKGANIMNAQEALRQYLDGESDIDDLYDAVFSIMMEITRREIND